MQGGSDGGGHADSVPSAASDARLSLVRSGVERWKGQLIDLGGRNNLRYYKDRATATLDFLSTAGADEGNVGRLLAGHKVRLSGLFDVDPDRLPAVARRARAAFKKAQENLDDSDPESIDRVCAIFGKLNSTGVDLFVYDLLTARLYRPGIRLHDLWAEACKSHQRLRVWSGGKADQHKFGVLVLRTLALLRDLDPKPRTLIDLDPVDFDTDWRKAAAAIERALELISLVSPDGFGVFAEKWLPGYGLIPILAALRSEIDMRRLGEKERADLRHWYWSNVFLERYSSAVESKSRKDCADMTRHWFDDGPDPDVFQEAQKIIGSPGFWIRTSASYASAVYSGVFSLLAIRNARDWRRGENIQLQELQDHHIMPQAFLKRHVVSRRVTVNSIANRTLISNETNGKIKDKAPKEYLEDASIISANTRADLLLPHFVDEATMAVLLGSEESLSPAEASAKYAEFVQLREQAIIGEIRRVCGIEISAHSDSEGDEGDEDEAAEDLLSGLDLIEEEELEGLDFAVA